MNYLNNIYLEPSDASKYKIMDSYYTGMTNNILEKLREQPYNLKIDQSPYAEDLNKIKYSFIIPGLDEVIEGDYLISNKLAFNSKLGNLLSKIHFNNLLSTDLMKRLRKVKNDIILSSNMEAIYNTTILMDLVEKVHVSEYIPPSDDYSIYMGFIHQMAFLQEFDTSNLIDISKVSGYKYKPPMVRVSDLKSSPPKVLYNLDENKIEKVIPCKYITIFLKDGTSNREVSFYLTSTETSTEFPEGVYKNIEVKKGHITAKHSCIFK